MYVHVGIIYKLQGIFRSISLIAFEYLLDFPKDVWCNESALWNYWVWTRRERHNSKLGYLKQYVMTNVPGGGL